MNNLLVLLLSIPSLVLAFELPSVRQWVMTNYIPRHNRSDGPWWDNKIIHSFGNSGLGGRFHAEIAPLVIDDIAYDGLDVSYNPSSPFPPTEVDTFVEDMFTHTSDVVFEIPVSQSIPPIILYTYISRGDLSIFTRRRWMSDHRVFKWFKEAAEKVPFWYRIQGIQPCDTM